MAPAVDFEAEYNNRARVRENPAIIGGWAKDAQAYRQTQHDSWRTIRYGESERQQIDFFPAANHDAAVVVFIHGGYWQALDRSFFSHMAAGLNACGISVAIPGYDLCPQVSVADIIIQMRAAALEMMKLGKRLVASGHSAGGHLAACLLATDWKSVSKDVPANPIRAAYAISGVFDLGPLVETSINGALGLDASTAKDASPLFWRPPPGGMLDAVVGDAESGEFLRQSREIAEVWGRTGAATRFTPIIGNHFTLLAPLTDPRSAVTSRLVELATL